MAIGCAVAIASRRFCISDCEFICRASTAPKRKQTPVRLHIQVFPLRAVVEEEVVSRGEYEVLLMKSPCFLGRGSLRRVRNLKCWTPERSPVFPRPNLPMFQRRPLLAE